MKKKDNISVFTDIYEEKIWGENLADKSFNGNSGPGSSLISMKNFLEYLQEFIEEHHITSIVDLGCGDWRSGDFFKQFDIKYTGYDAYQKMIDSHNIHFKNENFNFIHLDFVNEIDKIVSADLVILKDVIQHHKNKTIDFILAYLTGCGKFKYIITVNSSYQKFDNEDIASVNGATRGLKSIWNPLKKFNPELVKTYQADDNSTYDEKEICLIKIF